MTSIFEARQDQYQLLSYLVAQTSIEWVKKNICKRILQQKKEAKDRDLEERPQCSFFKKKRICKIETSPDYQILGTSDNFNSTISMQDQSW